MLNMKVTERTTGTNYLQGSNFQYPRNLGKAYRVDESSWPKQGLPSSSQQPSPKRGKKHLLSDHTKVQLKMSEQLSTEHE